MLLLNPEILLLDEPTKGLDAEFKQVFAEILQILLRRGTAVLMVSHDIEFCARYAHRCALSSTVASSPRDAAELLLRQQLLHHRRKPHGPTAAAPGGDGGGCDRRLRRTGASRPGLAGRYSAAAGTGGSQRRLQAQTAALVAQAGAVLTRRRRSALVFCSS